MALKSYKLSKLKRTGRSWQGKCKQTSEQFVEKGEFIMHRNNSQVNYISHNFNLN